MARLLPLALLAACVTSEPAPVGTLQAGIRFAMLPFRNLTADSDAATRLADDLRHLLEQRGASVAAGTELEDMLRARRIRYTDSLGVEAAREMARQMAADYLVLGSLLEYRSSPIPVIALAVRILDGETGARVHSDVVSLRGDDFVGLLGLGAITDEKVLAAEVTARIVTGLETWSQPDHGPFDRALLAGFKPPDPLLAYRREGSRPDELARVAVLPLTNRTSEPRAGDLLGEILTHQLFQAARIHVVERAELLRALVGEKVRSVDNLDPEVLQRVGRSLGVSHFVLGSVNLLREITLANGHSVPEIEATVRILDAESGQIVAAAGVRRRGDDYETVLGLGIVRDPVALATRLAHEITALVGA
ncbi:MAG: hypothetical protein AB1486_27315 [Planctomycetota bacterium]